MWRSLGGKAQGEAEPPTPPPIPLHGCAMFTTKAQTSRSQISASLILKHCTPRTEARFLGPVTYFKRAKGTQTPGAYQTLAPLAT